MFRTCSRVRPVGLPYREHVAVDAASQALVGVRVLIIEDDPAIGRQLAKGLSRAGCHATLAQTGREALEADAPDFVLLDLGLPDCDGLDLCIRLRRRSRIPMIVVTARGAEATRIAALDAGADDYVLKPFGLGELTARMRAVLRRAGESGPTVVGPLWIDVPARQVRVAGEQVALTAREFDILACLALEPGRVVSREEIFDRVWDEHWYSPRRVLDVHIAALRRKLGVAALIETVYGRGFRLADPGPV